MRVLITGGCGFIGHHLVSHLLSETDWEIVVLDGLNYAGDVNKLLDIPNYDIHRVQIYWHDLRAAIMPTLTRKIGPIDYILNVASGSSVEESIKSPVEFIHNNVMLVLNMLEFARQVKVKKFIQISTDEVYGPAPDGKFFSEWDTHLPSNPYAASKSAQDAIAVAYWRTYGVPIMITHTMNNYGERQDPEKLVPKAIRSIWEGKSMPIYGEYKDGAWESGTRVWLHATNHADALLYLLKNVEPTRYPEDDRPSSFNVAGLIEVSNLEMVQALGLIMGVEPICEWTDFHSLRPGHDRRYALDGSKLVNHGWKPPISFREGLERTVTFTLANKRWL